MNILSKLLPFIFIFCISCGPSTYPKIPLDTADPKLKERGELITTDVITSLTHEDGARYLLNKKYMTPLLHGRMMINHNQYEESYLMANLVIGKVKGFKLSEIIDKGSIKTLRYELRTDENSLVEIAELRIDINPELNLANTYLYITTKDGKFKRSNIFPRYK